MIMERKRKYELKKIFHSSKVDKDQPLATTSKDIGYTVTEGSESHPPSYFKRFLNYLYNKKNKTFCGRSCKSWLLIVTYSIMYFIFLSTYTMIFLYITLSIIKKYGDYHSFEKIELMTYSEKGIGLSATPTGVNNYPLIWYKDGDFNDYKKYVKAIDDLLSVNRRKRDVGNVLNLGPCGQSPYGYGDRPCIIVRINKQIKWSVEPVNVSLINKEELPFRVQEWLKLSQRKIWLHCDGYHSYDKEHIGQINYYPDPPGINTDMFPLDMESSSPLLAVQFSGFTIGMSLAVQCKLWYGGGSSSIEFVLYVAPKNSRALNINKPDTFT